MTEVLDSTSLKALSIDTRQEIMKLLVKRPYTSSELSKLLNKHVTTIGEHLSVLEHSGMVRRKDGEHKWVYYVLTEKGEKLFKPRYYSWVIVMSLSLVALLVGVGEMFSRSFYSGAADVAQETSKVLQAPAPASAASAASVPFMSAEILIGIVLVSASMIGFGYLLGRMMKK